MSSSSLQKTCLIIFIALGACATASAATQDLPGVLNAHTLRQDFYRLQTLSLPPVVFTTPTTSFVAPIRSTYIGHYEQAFAINELLPDGSRRLETRTKLTTRLGLSFSLADIAGSVTGLSLSLKSNFVFNLQNGSLGMPMMMAVYDVSTPFTALSGATNAVLYDDLGSGTLLGQFTSPAGLIQGVPQPESTIHLTLGASAINAINQAIANGESHYSVGLRWFTENWDPPLPAPLPYSVLDGFASVSQPTLTVTSIPEPATATLGLGILALMAAHAGRRRR